MKVLVIIIRIGKCVEIFPSLWASCSSDKTIKFGSVDTGNNIKTLNEDNAILDFFKINDFNLIAVGYSKRLEFWNAK